MKHRSFLAIAIAAAVTVVSLSGCGVLGSLTEDGPAPLPTPTAAAPSAQPTPDGESGLGDSVRDSGDIPDVCTLITEAEVKDLTGRGVSQIDEDGGQSGDVTRYCQWQQPDGQLAVFLSRTTEQEFQIKIEGAEPVDGVGEDAYLLAGHLYVLYGTVQIDVYLRGDSDAENLEKSKKIVDFLLPKI